MFALRWLPSASVSGRDWPFAQGGALGDSRVCAAALGIRAGGQTGRVHAAACGVVCIAAVGAPPWDGLVGPPLAGRVCERIQPE